MSNIAISVEGISKRYFIGRQFENGEKQPSLKRSLLSPFSYLTSSLRQPSEDEVIWAVKDVSFEVNRGEVLGIIGPNGAGKSTVLKILSRITEPTSGRALIHGRVGSLLEVGTGFHPELTGRENIYLNGTILGMKRSEIAEQFDNIVSFAEVDRFLDTPVKRYSSGMYVRLAFAVAAHLKPEILMVDEVLAVGDAAFQRKCLGKMSDVASHGRTVLFVSHNMAAVANLCHRAICLDKGTIAAQGDTEFTIMSYLDKAVTDSGSKNLNLQNRTGDGPIHFVSFHCETKRGEIVNNLISGQAVKLVLGYTSLPNDLNEKRDVTEVSIVIYTSDGTRLANLSSLYFNNQNISPDLSQDGKFVCSIPKLPLRSGRYMVDLYCEVKGQVSDWVRSAAYFDVEDGDYYGSGKITRAFTGSTFFEHSWDTC